MSAIPSDDYVYAPLTNHCEGLLIESHGIAQHADTATQDELIAEVHVPGIIMKLGGDQPTKGHSVINEVNNSLCRGRFLKFNMRQLKSDPVKTWTINTLA